MDWTGATAVLEKLAPMLAAGVGGPLAGGAVSALEGIFGLIPPAGAPTPDRQAALAEAISGANPDQLLALKKADQDYIVQMAALGFKNVEALAELAVRDTISARDMQIATRSWMPAALGIGVTLGFFGLTGALCFISVPAGNQPIVFGLTGILGTAWLTVMHFNFGGTSSAEQANKLLAASTPPAQ